MPFTSKIINQDFDGNRCFEKCRETSFINVNFCGPRNGEYALNDCFNIEIINSNLNLKYLLWNTLYLQVKNCNFGESCVDSIWHASNLNLAASNLHCDRVISHCSNLFIDSCYIQGHQSCWKCSYFTCKNTKIFGFCTFFAPNQGKFDNCELYGSRLFEEAQNCVVENCYIDSEDGLWNSQNIHFRNCTIKSKRFGWYSKDIVLENCRIIGEKPLCYCRNVRLFNCSFDFATESFEQSEIFGNIIGTLESIKLPLSGNLVIDEIPKIVDFDENNPSFSIRTYKTY